MVWNGNSVMAGDLSFHYHMASAIMHDPAIQVFDE